MDWETIRKEFPVTLRGVYFQSAAMSPLPDPVFNAIVREYGKLRDLGDVQWEKDIETVRDVKIKCARIINGDEEDIAFVANTSTAMSLVALALKRHYQNECVILSMEDEFPSSTIPYEYQGIKMNYVEPEKGRYPLHSILDRVDSRTNVVLTSYVQYNTGFRQDLLKLGLELKKRNILFLVNATQGFPFFPIDVKNMHIDVLTASLHKWGFSGHLGSLFYTSSQYRDRFPSPLAGWLSVVPPKDDIIPTKKNVPIQIHRSAEQYNFGTSNLQSLMAFSTALDYLLAIGLDKCRKRISELTKYLLERLKDQPMSIISPVSTEGERSAIFSFRIRGKNRACVIFLEKKKIYVSFRDDAVRVSLNIFNSIKDIDLLTEGLKEFTSTME